MNATQTVPVTPRQMVYMLLIFILGSSVVTGVNCDTQQDSWITLLLGAVFSLPIFFMYARIIQLMDGTDFYTGILNWFGGVAGRIIIGLFVWYFLHLASIVTRNFSEFIEIVAMPETPQLPLVISILLVCTYLCKSRIQVIGQWSVICCYIALTIVTITILAAASHMDLTNLLPVLEHSPSQFATSAVKVAAFPYLECVVFLPLITAVKKAKPYRLFSAAHIIGTVVLLTILLRNILCIGPELMVIEYFPSYTCARVMEIGNFLSRIEGTISINFIASGLTKITICMYSAVLGLSKLFHTKKTDFLTMPVCLLIIALCTISYSDVIQMFNFIDIYPLYAFPFQILLPAFIWLTGEWKNRTKQEQTTPVTA